MHRHMYQVSRLYPRLRYRIVAIDSQFGGGSHLCLGRNLALLEMNKLLPQLLRRYRFKLVHPGKPLKHHSVYASRLDMFWLRILCCCAYKQDESE
jgi:hypothetical protein